MNNIENNLKSFAIWLGENHFGRNSFGIWKTNCSSFKGMSDDEIVDMYLNRPNALQEHLTVVRKAIVSDFEKNYPHLISKPQTK